jgi:two-component system chemotaxis response regulator CheB
MTSGQRTRILIVDDSAVMRSLLRSVVCADVRLEVAGTAADGESALSAIATHHPDLVLLDVEMPVMDGLDTLRKMRARGHKIPVIMCSSLTQRGAKVTIEALACGASDYVAKPAGQSSREEATRTLSQDLLPKIHALTSLPQAATLGTARTLFPAALAPLPKATPISSIPTVLVIGVSTGGPAALEILLPNLPANFPLPVLIVQHMPELFTKMLAERLNSRCPLQVREGVEGEPVRAGTVYIAKGNWHLEVQAGARLGLPATLHLNQGALENHCRPAVDVLFRSAAAVYGTGVLAVVLTGMGSDGMIGARLIREHSGSVLAQDQASSTVWGMPGSVITAGLAHKVLPLNLMASEILRLASRTHAEPNELRERVA